ncbi:MAG: hypothetical protein IIB00_10895 [candidate division Zixibacteria bacterium]|nr:hypothetical protein [candidate division Zixibacteria bacterium]
MNRGLGESIGYNLIISSMMWSRGILDRGAVALAIALVAQLFTPQTFAVSDEGLIKYYLDGLRSVFEEEYSYVKLDSLEAVILVRETELDNRSRPVRIDTAIVRYTFVRDSAGELSRVKQEVLVGSHVDREPVFPRLFESLPWNYDYTYSLYPNDLGSGDFAIAYDSDSAIALGVPTGIFLIDRSTFRPTYIAKRTGGQREGAFSREEWYDYQDGRISLVRLKENYRDSRFMGDVHYVIDATILKYKY